MVRLPWRRDTKPSKPNKSLEIAIYLTLEKIMADVAHLTAAVTSLSDAIAANAAAITDITAVVAAGTTDQAAIDGIATALVHAADGIKANTAALLALKPAA